MTVNDSPPAKWRSCRRSAGPLSQFEAMSAWSFSPPASNSSAGMTPAVVLRCHSARGDPAFFVPIARMWVAWRYPLVCVAGITAAVTLQCNAAARLIPDMTEELRALVHLDGLHRMAVGFGAWSIHGHDASRRRRRRSSGLLQPALRGGRDCLFCSSAGSDLLSPAAVVFGERRTGYRLGMYSHRSRS